MFGASLTVAVWGADGIDEKQRRCCQILDEIRRFTADIVHLLPDACELEFETRPSETADLGPQHTCEIRSAIHIPRRGIQSIGLGLSGEMCG